MIDVNTVRLSATVSEIYEAASDPAAWNIAVESLRQLLHGSKACVQRIGPDLGAGDAVSTTPDLLFQRLYAEQHADQPNVLADAVNLTTIGAVYRDHELVGGDRLRRSRFWNDWMAPQDMHGGLGVKLLQAGQSYWIFDIQRGSKASPFESRDAELFSIVAPHVARALKINRNFQSIQTQASAFQHVPFGVILVDADMKIMASNAAAEALLCQAGSGLSQARGHLTIGDHRSLARLTELIVNACSSGGDILPGLGGDLLVRSRKDLCGDLRVSIVPPVGHLWDLPLVGRQAALFVREISLGLPADFGSQLRSLFGLTKREAEIAVALASGLELKTAAENAGIKFNSARSYLERIFFKTKTHKQSQLVALLMSIVPPAGRL